MEEQREYVKIHVSTHWNERKTRIINQKLRRWVTFRGQVGKEWEKVGKGNKAARIRKK